MTTDGGSAGTCGRAYRTEQPIPQPRQSDDHAEPGHRRETADKQKGRQG